MGEYGGILAMLTEKAPRTAAAKAAVTQHPASSKLHRRPAPSKLHRRVLLPYKRLSSTDVATQAQSER